MKLFLFFLPLFLFLGCGRATYSGVEPARPSVEVGAAAERMVLRRGSLDLRVEEPDSTLAQLVQLAGQLGGYPAETDGYSATLRLPDERLDEAMTTVATYGKVVDRRLVTTDVTEEYSDVGIRLENAERLRQRYLTLLERAETVTETIEVERELARVNETLDLLRGRQLRLENQAALATLTVRVDRREKPGPLGYVFVGLWKGISWLFVR